MRKPQLSLGEWTIIVAIFAVLTWHFVLAVNPAYSPIDTSNRTRDLMLFGIVWLQYLRAKRRRGVDKPDRGFPRKKTSLKLPIFRVAL